VGVTGVGFDGRAEQILVRQSTGRASTGPHSSAVFCLGRPARQFSMSSSATSPSTVGTHAAASSVK
jgi:hypothetical protein